MVLSSRFSFGFLLLFGVISFGNPLNLRAETELGRLNCKSVSAECSSRCRTYNASLAALESCIIQGDPCEDAYLASENAGNNLSNCESDAHDPLRRLAQEFERLGPIDSLRALLE